jgi:hypothetical protein
MKPFGMRSLLFCFLFTIVISCFGDSTNITVPTISNTNIQSPSTTVPAPPITNEGYGTLPVCTPPMVCPDINGRYPNGRSPNCPEACTVTQTPPGIYDPTNTPTNPTYPWDAPITNPVCPAGYAQVTQYNMQDEYAWITSPRDIQVSSIDTYKTFQPSDCHGGGNQDAVWSSCQQGRNNTAPYCDSANPTLCPDSSNTDPDGHNGNFAIAVGYNSLIWVYNVWKRCYLDGKCSARTSCGAQGSENFQYLYYNTVYCRRSQPGNNPTGFKVPTSAVCARVKITWSPIN